jgi:signal transduction histidine kinase
MLEADSGAPLVLATVEDITDKRSAHEELQRAHSELQEFAPRLLSAQEDERRRISRELHDDFGQRLSLLAMSVDVLGRKVPAERSAERAEIARIMEGLNDLVTDVHNMSHQLHSAKLEHLGLRVALNEVCRQLALQHHIAIILSADGLPEFLPEEVSLAFYRVAQEALSNAVKHSGSDRVEVSLRYQDELLCMRVRDFGVGFDPDLRKSGLGLVTMQERLRMIGGALRFNPVAEGGIELQAEAKVDVPGLDGRKIA